MSRTKPPKRHATNVEMLKRLMEHSQCGGLIQAFGLTAIEKYAEQCIEAGPAMFDSGFMDGAVWIRCATEARDAISAHLTPAVQS